MKKCKSVKIFVLFLLIISIFLFAVKAETSETNKDFISNVIDSVVNFFNKIGKASAIDADSDGVTLDKDLNDNDPNVGEWPAETDSGWSKTGSCLCREYGGEQFYMPEIGDYADACTICEKPDPNIFRDEMTGKISMLMDCRLPSQSSIECEEWTWQPVITEEPVEVCECPTDEWEKVSDISQYDLNLYDIIELHPDCKIV